MHFLRWLSLIHPADEPTPVGSQMQQLIARPTVTGLKVVEEGSHDAEILTWCSQVKVFSVHLEALYVVSYTHMYL